MEKINCLADFNDLVREAFTCQEGFDNWDEGKTHYPSTFDHKNIRLCDLETVEREWDEANLALVSYVMKHGPELCVAMGADPEEILV